MRGRVSLHAVLRYIERVEDVSIAEANRILKPYTQIGTGAAKMANGCRIQVVNHVVTTVTPKDRRKRLVYRGNGKTKWRK